MGLPVLGRGPVTLSRGCWYRVGSGGKRTPSHTHSPGPGCLLDLAGTMVQGSIVHQKYDLSHVYNFTFSMSHIKKVENR